MAARPEIPSGTNLEEIKIVVNALYLCLGHAVRHIDKVEGTEAAAKFKTGLLAALQDGSIDMAIFEDTKTYDFVIAMIEELVAET